MKRKLLLILLAVCSLSISFGQTQTKKVLTEKQKIDYLISSIENLKNAKFYRNGSLYDAKAAADHLRMKMGKAGNRIKTAQDFIDKIASSSYMSGEDYKIIFSNGKEITTNKYLNDKLKAIQ